MDIKEILNYKLLELERYSLSVSQLLFFLFILFFARFLLFIIKKVLKRQVEAKRLDAGKEYAVYQIIVYLTYVIAISVGLDSIGVKLTVLLAGSTALLVGLGLGLQDFFRDLVAGFIILWERTVTAGDVVEIAGTVGRVQEVGLRTTSVFTRDDIVMIIPNQLLTNDKVVNWSQNRKATRFAVKVGVAYGSDTRLVERLLLEVAKENPQVEDQPEAIVHFTDFGNSSLDFSLLFYSHNLFRIERIKSELRYAIDQKFRANGITIPFPQRDVWIRKAET